MSRIWFFALKLLIFTFIAHNYKHIYTIITEIWSVQLMSPNTPRAVISSWVLNTGSCDGLAHRFGDRCTVHLMPLFLSQVEAADVWCRAVGCRRPHRPDVTSTSQYKSPPFSSFFYSYKALALNGGFMDRLFYIFPGFSKLARIF